MFDFDHPMFRPWWVRIALLLFTGGWALVEAYLGNLFWAVLFGAVFVAAFVGLVIRDPFADKDGD